MQSNNDIVPKDSSKDLTLLMTDAAVFWIQSFCLSDKINEINALAHDNQSWQHLFDGDQGNRNEFVFAIIDYFINTVGKKFKEADLDIVRTRLREWVVKKHVEIEESVSKKEKSVPKTETEGEMKASVGVTQVKSVLFPKQNNSQPKSLDVTPSSKLTP